MIKTDSLQKDTDMVIGKVYECIALTFCEDTKIYDNCETSEEFEKADEKKLAILQVLVDNLKKTYKLN